jgi:hypothetical protein
MGCSSSKAADTEKPSPPQQPKKTPSEPPKVPVAGKQNPLENTPAVTKPPSPHEATPTPAAVPPPVETQPEQKEEQKEVVVEETVIVKNTDSSESPEIAVANEQEEVVVEIPAETTLVEISAEISEEITVAVNEETVEVEVSTEVVEEPAIDEISTEVVEEPIVTDEISPEVVEEPTVTEPVEVEEPEPVIEPPTAEDVAETIAPEETETLGSADQEVQQQAVVEEKPAVPVMEVILGEYTDESGHRHIVEEVMTDQGQVLLEDLLVRDDGTLEVIQEEIVTGIVDINAAKAEELATVSTTEEIAPETEPLPADADPQPVPDLKDGEVEEIIVEEPEPTPVVEEEPLPVVTTTEEEPTQTRTISTAVAPPAKKTGMLMKQGHLVKNWKNRYFVLEKGVLTYYDNSTMKDKKGDLSLKNTQLIVDNTLVRIESREGANVKGHTELVLDIKFENERLDWMKAFNDHVKYYWKGERFEETVVIVDQLASVAEGKEPAETAAAATTVSSSTPTAAAAEAEVVTVVPPASTPTPLTTEEAVTTAASVPPAKKTGMIFKQGHMVKNWKNRFFVLDQGILTYYENNSMKDKKGDMNLKNTKVIEEGTLLYIKGPSELVLEIKFENERKDWIKTLEDHISFYSNRS